MTKFKEYRAKNIIEMCAYEKGMDMEYVSVSTIDRASGSPMIGDMIARNPKDHTDKWLVPKKYFEKNLEEITQDAESDEKNC